MSDGKEIVVLSKKCRLENGLLVYHYTVGSPEVFGTAGYDNPKMSGFSLAGTVLETKQESVRVMLKIDGEQSSGEGYWYPWMPETGNLMYCMPEAGERITISFDDGEGTARVRLHLTGWIRNLENGDVEMEIQGMDNKIDFLLKFMNSLKRIKINKLEKNIVTVLNLERGFKVCKK